MKPARARGGERWARRERAAEIALLALLAVQTARLGYALTAPVGPVGRWTPGTQASVAPPMIAGLDPFAGGPSTGPIAAAAIDLVLSGVRQDRATGRGTAFLGKAGQPQTVYGVGDEIAPGTRLAAIGFDHVTLDQGGRRTQLFLDQSTPAAPAAPVAAASPAAPISTPAAPAAALAREFEATARIEAGVVTGYALGPAGTGERFRGLGLQAGDVLVAVNGRPVQALAQIDVQGIGADGAMIEVERGGQRVSLRARP